MSVIYSTLAGIFATVSASSLKYLTNEDLVLIFKALLVIVFVVSNVLVWWLQLKTMSSGSTIKAIVVFTGSNFISATIFGAVIHGEQDWARTLTGCGLVLLGVLVIDSSRNDDKAKAD